MAAASAGTIWPQTAKLLASDGWGLDLFGTSASVFEDTALVGAQYDDDRGFNSGSVYVFVRSGGVWTEQTKLLASDGAEDDNFGRSVSLFGDTALIGARLGGGNGTGSAYVFVRSEDTWTQQAKLLASDGEPGDDFGGAVWLLGDTALIGATLDDDNGAESGSAYVFVRSGDTWIQQAKLVAIDGGAGDNFGGSVSLSENTALIGASSDDDNGVNSGSAYVFVRSGGAWTQKAKIVPSDGTGFDSFGSPVRLSDDTALVGALGVDDQGANAGSAYVFVRSGHLWTQQAKLLASDGEYADWFGTSVALFGDTALVGATGDDDNGSGSVYVFVRSGGVWSERGKLLAGDGEPFDRFGSSVSLFRDTALVGVPQDEDNGPASGSAYVFFGGPIFADGFESGDTSAWANTVP